MHNVHFSGSPLRFWHAVLALLYGSLGLFFNILLIWLVKKCTNFRHNPSIPNELRNYSCILLTTAYIDIVFISLSMIARYVMLFCKHFWKKKNQLGRKLGQWPHWLELHLRLRSSQLGDLPVDAHNRQLYDQLCVLDCALLLSGNITQLFRVWFIMNF